MAASERNKVVAAFRGRSVEGSVEQEGISSVVMRVLMRAAAALVRAAAVLVRAVAVLVRAARVLSGVVAGALTSVALAAGPLPDLSVSGANGADFPLVLAPTPFEFPRDHGPHPRYRHEWWYVTGNLDSSDGQRFGFELTFFRFGLGTGGEPRHDPASGADPAGDVTSHGAPNVAARSDDARSKWRSHQIYMAHFAITDVSRGQFRFSSKLSREAIGLAGAQNPPLHVWVDDWSLTSVSPDDTYWTLRAAESGYELTLDAQALLQPILNGDQGFSRKTNDPGAASYYYSIPRVAVHGSLSRDGKPMDVHGLAWLDREWGSSTLSVGWDWFALQLNDGSSFMFYVVRHEDGRRDPNSAGTWVSPTGQSRRLSNDDVQIDVLDYWTNSRGDRYPSHWRVRVPSVNLDVDVRPALQNQELTTAPRYWEGAVDVTPTGGKATGGAQGNSIEGGLVAGGANAKVGGRGYVELVGYAGR